MLRHVKVSLLTPPGKLPSVLLVSVANFTERADREVVRLLGWQGLGFRV